MTRKDYKAIAGAIKKSRNDNGDIVEGLLMAELYEAFGIK